MRRLAALDDPVRAELRVPVAPALAPDAVTAVERQRVLEQSLDAMHLRVLDEGPLARDRVPPVERREDRDRGHHAAPVVGEPDRVLGRRPAPVGGFARDPERSAHGLAQDVVGGPDAPRAPAAETAEPLVDEARVDLGEMLIAHPPPVESSGPEVLDEDVHLGRELRHRGPRLGPVEVEGDELLVRVRPEEAEAGPRLRHPAGEREEERLVERGRVTHRLAAPRRLDLDDLGSQLGQVSRAGGTEDVLRAGEDANALQDLRLAGCDLVVEELLTVGLEVGCCHRLCLLIP